MMRERLVYLRPAETLSATIYTYFTVPTMPGCRHVGFRVSPGVIAGATRVIQIAECDGPACCDYYPVPAGTYPTEQQPGPALQLTANPTYQIVAFQFSRPKPGPSRWWVRMPSGTTLHGINVHALYEPED